MITRCSSRLACGRVHPVVFFNPEALQHQKVKGHHGQGDMMMPAAPGASFKVIQSQFGFQLLIVLLHPPAHLGPIDQPPEVSLLRQIGKPILRGSCFCWRPLHKQPADRFGDFTFPMLRCRLHPERRKTAGQWPLGSLAPGDFPPDLLCSFSPNSPTLTGAGKARLQVRGPPCPA